MTRMQHTLALLASHLKTLRLPTMLRECEAVARHAGESDATYELFLQQLAEAEVQRASRRPAAWFARRSRSACRWLPATSSTSGVEWRRDIGLLSSTLRRRETIWSQPR